MQLERQLRLANARYKELQHELDHMKVQMAGPGQTSPQDKKGEPAKSAGDVTPKECPVPIPQPAQDRSAVILHLHLIVRATRPGSLHSPAKGAPVCLHPDMYPSANDKEDCS